MQIRDLVNFWAGGKGSEKKNKGSYRYNKMCSKYRKTLNIMHGLRAPLLLKVPVLRMFYQILKIVFIIQGPSETLPTPFNLLQPLESCNSICQQKQSYAYSYRGLMLIWLSFVSKDIKLLKETYLFFYSIFHGCIARYTMRAK